MLRVQSSIVNVHDVKVLWRVTGIPWSVTKKSEIWNQDIWDLEIARFLHLKAEIIKLKLDNPNRGRVSPSSRYGWRATSNKTMARELLPTGAYLILSEWGYLIHASKCSVRTGNCTKCEVSNGSASVLDVRPRVVPAVYKVPSPFPARDIAGL